MDELSFRGPGAFRLSWRHFAYAVAAIGAEWLVSYSQLSAAGVYCVLVGSVLCVGLGFFSWYRSRCTVGAEGIFISWGLGGRTYSWREIRWIDVRETEGEQGKALAVRVFLTNGRRRSLPGLQHNPVYQAPNFYADYHRVVRWWERSTEPGARVRPTAESRNRVTPWIVGVVLAVLIAVAAVAGVAMRG
ncbi:hypothetical protein ABZX93_31560 [Streptomyces sp. NPDC006632]|uniref:hypothetical protein n=1 Tax=Streptomyces sp. NPDC006632 TaxID=3157182 RepID=UPI0033B2DEE1